MNLPPANSASPARGSIGFEIRRLLTIRSSTTRAALASASSTAARSPYSQSKARLLGTSSWTRGWPGALAVAVSVTAGRLS